MADAGRQNLQQHLAAGRLGVDRLAATADLETAHFRFSHALFLWPPDFSRPWTGNHKRRGSSRRPHSQLQNAEKLVAAVANAGFSEYLCQERVTWSPASAIPMPPWPRLPSKPARARRPSIRPGTRAS